MASSSYPPDKHSPPIVIRFFTIIHNESLQLENLKIPNKFTSKYGDGVPNPVYLKPPDGTQWKIEWTKHDDGEIFFENGWKEFAAYYSLNHGHLVRFDYNRTCFQIHIFNMSGLEIDYPSNDQTCDDDSVEILDEIPASFRGQSTMTLESSPSRMSATETETMNVEESNLEMPVIASTNKKLDVFDPGTSGFRALEEAQKFSSEYPSFIVKIRRANLWRSRANFEAALFRRYFKKKEYDVNIRFEGNLLPAKLRYYKNSNAIISAGWMPFARASKLQPGDVCVFELIDRDDPVFDVHIYRAQG
ncbi:hypothetical protein PIB30_077086 [Stylosanthes scabra]|uniref:TF-B3 domain-containing protein n=1 Tax=Stylosanthes scabra TaxID=79078 RepID=A0ABU6TPZ7_9FABA|nr:hypothetical protein [Stylosanthes scabra]